MDLGKNKGEEGACQGSWLSQHWASCDKTLLLLTQLREAQEDSKAGVCFQCSWGGDNPLLLQMGSFVSRGAPRERKLYPLTAWGLQRKRNGTGCLEKAWRGLNSLQCTRN